MVEDRWFGGMCREDGPCFSLEFLKPFSYIYLCCTLVLAFSPQYVCMYVLLHGTAISRPYRLLLVPAKLALSIWFDGMSEDGMQTS